MSLPFGKKNKISQTLSEPLSHVRVIGPQPEIYDQDDPKNNLSHVRKLHTPKSEAYEALPDAEIIDLLPHIEASSNALEKPRLIRRLAQTVIEPFRPF